MILRHIARLLTLLFIHSTTYSQKIAVQNGTPFSFKTEDAIIDQIISLGTKDASFLERTKEGYRIIGFNEKLTSTTQQPIALPLIPGKTSRFFYAEQMQDKIYFFSTYFDEYKKEITLYASDLDVKKGRFMINKPLITIQNDAFNKVSQPFKIQRNADSTQLLFYTEITNPTVSGYQLRTLVTNNALNEQWKADITFPILKTQLELHDITVDKAGNLLAIASTHQVNKRDWKSQQFTEVLFYNPKTKEITASELSNKETLLLNPRWMIHPTHDLAVQGFFSKKVGESLIVDGFYQGYLESQTGKVVKNELSNFDPLLCEQMKKHLTPSENELFPMRVRHAFWENTNERCIVAEVWKQTLEVDSEKGMITEKQQFGDVLILFLNETNYINKSFIREKNQLAKWKYKTDGEFDPFVTSGKEELPFLGIATLYSNRQLQLLFNDHPKNVERRAADKKEKTLKTEESVTIMDTYRANGVSESKLLFPVIEKDDAFSVRVMPVFSRSIKTDDLLIFGRKGKVLRLSKIALVK